MWNPRLRPLPEIVPSSKLAKRPERWATRLAASIDDAWVYTRIEAKLVGHTAAPAFKINVDVENDVVTLRGEVKTPEMKEEAERIARETAGVKEVRNLLQVRA